MPYQEKMLNILKNNTTLNDVVIFAEEYWKFSYYAMQKRKEGQITYYTTLNKCGRGLVRDSGIKACDIVNILAEAPEKDENTPGSFCRQQILYGLLRELPGNWSAHVLGQNGIHSDEGRGLKHKASEL